METVRLAVLRWPRPMIGGDRPHDEPVDDCLRLDISFPHQPGSISASASMVMLPHGWDAC
jgi:hypothetical protein